MLLGNFFKIIDKDKTIERGFIKIKLIRGHSIYKGHFPEMPIAPGACLIQMVKESLEAISLCELVTIKIDNAKFMNPINPDKNSLLEMKLDYEEMGKEIKCGAQIKDEETIFFKFKGTFKRLDK